MTPLAELLGESPAIQAVRDTVGRLLAHGAEGRRLPALLILGETGTGKGLKPALLIWGADYPHPDCLWPDSRLHLEKNLGTLPERVRRKITSENVANLYQLPSGARAAS